MAKAKVRDYHEPWTARQRTIPGPVPFAGGAPDYLDAEAVDRIVSAHAKLVANADWLLWGSRMASAGEAAMPLSPGELATFDDNMIVATFGRGAPREGNAGHGDMARRAAACVSACAGIADPDATIASIRELLRDLAAGEADREDIRVLACLARLIPPERGEKHHEGQD